jgi:hypothetical protein
MTLDPRDAEFLLGRPEFLRFLGAAIHAAGIVGQQVGADGRLTRDLSFLEAPQPGVRASAHGPCRSVEPIRASDTQALTTLTAALHANLTLKDKANDRRKQRTDRYDDLPSSGE